MVQDGCCDVGGMRWVPTPGPLTSGHHHQWPRVHTRAVTIMIPVIVTSSILGSHYLALSSLALDRTIQLAKYVSHLFHSPGYRKYKPQLKPSPRRCGSRWVKCEHMKIWRVVPGQAKSIYLSIYLNKYLYLHLLARTSVASSKASVGSEVNAAIIKSL